MDAEVVCSNVLAIGFGCRLLRVNELEAQINDDSSNLNFSNQIMINSSLAQNESDLDSSRDDFTKGLPAQLSPIAHKNERQLEM